ncbi:MraY family glycosyltransferase [Streptomyces sp. VRA16 Mangrove soil]|uniref:MraY family glycosyltransferase n=1 Tax=Streptomyces sp. VRA16 Mangrove soil TaxID=2817434 RepID=UPI001A9D14C8|nr:MraY family glycosyltransferase [Streptomyces sp. VRA16 Mangrove soil]MBO1333638.1 undecaprenyl/decaprenyl-phosphate alpha-N-acetylglucosaminyl 1-phosphate transferase [Streptomyces sp. VRA16 Mangrove soil]
MLYGLAAAATALLLAAVLTAALRAFALRTALVKVCRDRPGARTARARAVPCLGGVAVACATGAVSVAGAASGLAPLGSTTGTLLLAAGAVAALGFLHDVRPMGARARVIVEAGAATVVVHGTGLGLLPGALAVLWIVFVTNAFNLLDNSDGAMGTVAVVTVLGLCVCAGAEGIGSLAVVLGLLAASLTGFLMHNWHPAQVLLGDCGSLFTGFVVACAALLVNVEHEAPASLAALFAVTAVATADTVLVLVSRRRAGRGLLRGGTDHIAHRLRRLGLTTAGVAVVLGLAAGLTTATGVLLHRGTVSAGAVWWPAGAAAVAVALLLRVPVYGARRGGVRAREQVSAPARAGQQVTGQQVAGPPVDLARG